MIRSHFFRRVGCLFLLLNFFAALVFILLVGLAAKLLGLIQVPGTYGWAIPLAIALFVLGMGLLVWVGRGLQHISAPFSELLGAANRLAGGDYSARVSERGSPEVRSLVRAFNSMAARLQATDEQRRNLLADVTHELRTPLTVIQGNLEGILDGVYAVDEARLKSILDETQVLARLVDDLRTLTLAESGALQLRKEPTDLAVLINEVAAAFRAQSDSAGVKLEIRASDDLPLLSLDPERMREVLSNLIANAIRYTPSGGVIRLIYQVGRSGSPNQASLEIQDTGPGIPPEVLPHVFDRFYKERDSTGMGLGLSIAKNLVEAHQGTISAESNPGKGTTIRIALPVSE
jgi:signal transduction histidine kinase